MIITDDLIDNSTIKIWTCFSDTTILDAIKKFKKLATKSKQMLSETKLEKALSGKEWHNLPFRKKIYDWITPGANSNGTPKGWFEHRQFPTITMKATDLTYKSLIKAIDDGFIVKVDYTGATKERAKLVSDLLSMAFDREFLKLHGQAATDASNLVGSAVGGVTTAFTGSPTKGAAAGLTAKTAILKAEQKYYIDKYNEYIDGTDYEDMKITPEDQNHEWYDRFLMFVSDHPYASIATVVGLVIAFKSRNWIWDRLKLGFNNLFQGTVIAKYQFQLIDDTPYTFEYDLRFNKWRLLYLKFKWKDDAYPDEQSIQTFIKTNHCKQFISKLKQYYNIWIENRDVLQYFIDTAETQIEKKHIRLIKKVLNDIDEIDKTLFSMEYKIG